MYPETRHCNEQDTNFTKVDFQVLLKGSSLLVSKVIPVFERVLEWGWGVE